jgi:hypothetical protein
MPIADAAIDAYESGQHIEGRTGRVAFAPGRNQSQYVKALQVKALGALARGICLKHNS